MTCATDPFSALFGLLETHYKKLTDAREVYEVIVTRMNTLDSLPELIAFLGQHLKPKELEKKRNGEVFTPPTMIQEKFDRLTDVDPTIWSNPNKKFLDPANGIGNYPALAFHRLMEGLEEAIPDAGERKRHILENMLYMCELSAKNVEVCRSLFDPKGEYSLNLYHGSFLDLNPLDEWKVESFDVVFGNPPYNESHDKKEGQGGSGSRTQLYPEFVKRSMGFLKENGYMIFIHPAMWRKPHGILRDILFGHQLHYLKMYTKQQGTKIFGGAITRVDWYILQKKLTDIDTHIVFDDGTEGRYPINSDTPLICSHGYDIWYRMYRTLQTGENEYLPVIKQSIANSKCHPSSNETNVYPLIHSTTNTGVSKVSWFTKPHPNQYKKKVCFAEIEVLYPVLDQKGVYGTTDNVQCILVSGEEEGEYLCRYLSSRLIQYVVGATKWSNFRTDHAMFQFIPYPKDLPPQFSDADVYAYFGLTSEQIQRIETEQRKGGLVNHTTLMAPDVYVPPPSDALDSDIVSDGQTDYAKMTVVALKQCCKEKGITGISGKKKQDLIAMLLAVPTATTTLLIKRPRTAKK